jgi:uncharacterized protein with ParB-like and HNH nuclease domain
MKTIYDLRGNLDLYPQELSSQIKYFKGNDIDWDVYLPTRDKNLQRDFVWTLEQKRELIWSVLIGRHIPHCAIINSINKENENEDKYLIIDGKQRLSSIFDYIDNKFTIIIDDVEYLFSELPKDYQNAITYYHFRYYVVNEPWDTRITDEQKIAWFKFINFAGTPQDKEHLNSL